LLARKLGLRFTDMDAEVERLHFKQKGERLRFRKIFQKYRKDYFRNLETAALQALSVSGDEAPFILATGGGLPLAEENRILLKGMGVIVFLDVAQDVLLARIVARGVPAFFPYPDDPARSLAELLVVRRPIYGALAQITVACRSESPDTIADTIINQLETHPCED
jgi:shikimate kinase